MRKITAAVLLLLSLTARAAFAQAEKLGVVRYTPVGGWAKTSERNIVAFSESDRAAGKFCVITLYGATPGAGNPQSDFAREWNNLVVKTFKAGANPKTEAVSADGWTIIGGGAEVEAGGGKAVAVLTVISGFGKTVSVLGVFNDQSYAGQVDSFIRAIEIDEASAPANSAAAAAPPALDGDGSLVIPQPARQLTIADLVGEWGDHPGRIATTYVSRSDGTHAGTDSLHFTSKWTIGSDGRYTNDFFEVRNGKKLRDVTTGTVTIAGRLITIRHQATARYVVRGWLELPGMTVLQVAGPWYDGQDIPEKFFTDFGEDSRFFLTTKWVRRK